MIVALERWSFEEKEVKYYRQVVEDLKFCQRGLSLVRLEAKTL